MQRSVSNMDRTQCVGCRACEQRCPSKCIEMTYDEEGFLYPRVNEALCTGCGVCSEVCPIQGFAHVQSNFSQKAYGAWNTDEQVRWASSSGGVFTALAKAVLNQGGVVFGCAFDSELNAIHIKVDTVDRLFMLRGSKYVQSDTLDTYTQAEELLSKGVEVLYSGTPCQIAGLKAFLGKQYDNLFTVDLICHGVPSPLLFRRYIEALSRKYKGRIVSFEFRHKSKYNSLLSVRWIIDRGDRQVSRSSSWQCSPYCYGFEMRLLQRPVCYVCPYANMSRVGDVTIGDLWGAQEIIPGLSPTGGVSAVIVNSKNGMNLLERARADLHLIQCNEQDIALHNPNLRLSSERPKLRSDIYRLLYQGDFDEQARRYLRPRTYYFYQIASRVPEPVRKALKVLIRRK